MKHKSYLSQGAIWAAVTGIYFLAGHYGLKLAFIHPSASAVWPPTGIAIAALLLFGTDIWPSIFVGALWVNLSTSGHLFASSGIAFGNTLEAFVGAVLAKRFAGAPYSFRSLSKTMRFVLSAACVAPLASASIGVLSLRLAHLTANKSLESIGLTWWLGDAVGALVLSPFLILWFRGQRQSWNFRRLPETLALTLCGVILGVSMFGGLFPSFMNTEPLEFLGIPLVLWAAFRFGPRESISVGLLLSCVALWGTLHGHGPFHRNSPNDSLLFLQAFMGVTTLLGLAVAATVAEKNDHVSRLRIQSAVSRVLLGSGDEPQSFKTILQTIGEGFGWEYGGFWTVDQSPSVLTCVEVWQAASRPARQFEETSRALHFPMGTGLPGAVWETRQPIWIQDVSAAPNFPRFPTAMKEGLHAGFAFPVQGSSGVLGVIEFLTRRFDSPDETLLQTVSVMGNEIGQLLERRLTDERRKGVVDAALDCIISINHDDIIQDFNPAAEKTFGYQRKDIIGKTLANTIIPPELRERHLKGIQRFLESGVGPILGKRVEMPAMRSDGSRISVELAISTIYVAGKPLFTAYLRDITETKKMQETLGKLLSEKTEAHLQIQARYRMLVEETKDYAIFLLDTTGHVTSWNAGAERMKLYTSSEILGKHFSVFYTQDDQMAGKPQRFLKSALDQSRWEDEGWRVRKDGTRFWANCVLTALYDSSGKLTGYGKITRDLTEKRKAEELSRRQEVGLAQTRKLEAIGQLAGGVAHDFNNLITGILGVTEEVKGSLEAHDPRVADLEAVVTAASRAFDLTKQLLAFGRRQTVQPEVLDINLLVAETSKLLGRLIGENIRLTIQTNEVAPVLADAGQLQQIIMNLTINARDAMPNGGDLTLSTANVYLDEETSSRYLKAASGKYVMLEIRDTGTGMSQDTISHIFEPFFTTKDKHQGTGLGLSTVYGIVKQHNADIEVQSDVGKGTTFRVYWPASEKLPTFQNTGPSQAQKLAGNATILVVEDEDIVRRVVIRKLTKLGYKVIGARTGEEAMERITQTPERIDLVLTDVIMPGMNGKQLIEQIRQRFPQVAAVYMSGYSEDLIARHGVVDSNVVFIDKSTLEANLASKIQAALGRN